MNNVWREALPMKIPEIGIELRVFLKISEKQPI
jgi:hypothetical protein